MANYLFTVWPFAGHVNPAMSVAKVLQAGGHDVAFYTGAKQVPVIEREGFDVFPFRAIDEQRIWNLIEALEARSPIDRTPLPLLRALFRDKLVGTIPGQVSDIRGIIEAWQPDVIVTDPMLWGPILVLCETTRLPVAVLSFLIGCPIPGRDAPPWGPGLPAPRSFGTRLLARAATLANDVVSAGMRRELNRIRAGFGLPPMGCSVNAFPARLPMYLIPSVPELDYQRTDLPPCVHYVGPCVWNKPSGDAPPSWFQDLPADVPWVHVTEGTAHHQDPFVLKAAARGLANLPLQAILTTGSQRSLSATDLGVLAPNVRVERWVSHSDLLPRCAAIVTTGGAGTIMAALQAGVPLVVVPTRWDKPDNAQRVVEAGVGLRIAPGRCTPDRLRGAVQRILREPRFAANAQRLARRLDEAPGPAGAATLLESMARPAPTRAPAPAP